MTSIEDTVQLADSLAIGALTAAIARSGRWFSYPPLLPLAGQYDLGKLS